MAGFLGGGFFGSGAKSAQTTTTTHETGFSEIGGSAQSVNLSGLGKNSNVSILDAGAIDRAFSFAGDALERSLRQVEVASSSSAGAMGDALRAVAENARSETENVLLQGGKWLVIAVIAVAGFYALGKMKG